MKRLTGLISIALLFLSASCGNLATTAPVPPLVTTQAPTPVPDLPAPPPPFEVHVIPEEPHYLPGQPVRIQLSIVNVSSEVITVSQYPREIDVSPGFDYDLVLFGQPGGALDKVISPGDTATVEFAWDQKDATGKQVAPGWYNIRSHEIMIKQQVSQSNSQYTFTPGTRVLIQYPQGAMEKSFEVNQSQTADGVTVTLERVELTAETSSFHFFFIPPGYVAPRVQSGPIPPPPPPDAFTAGEAEYSLAGVSKDAGTAGYNARGDGITLVWGEGRKLDPVLSDATEITFTITQLNDKQGPWVFRIPLQ